MNKHFKALEFDKILEMLGKECSFADAREQALTLKPVFTKEETEKLLKETDDAYVLIGKFGTPSFGSPTNCANQLRRAQAGSGLTTLELLRIGENLRVIRSLRQWRNASDDRASSLDKYFNNLMPNKFLEEKINDAIIAEDEISDKASPTLSDIRRKKSVLHHQKQEKFLIKLLEVLTTQSSYKTRLSLSVMVDSLYL